MTRRLRVNSPNVIFETIEGEVILIDLKTGTYYSLRDAGAAIWQAIVQGASEDEIVVALGATYDADADRLGTGVADLLDELEGEGLVRPDDGEVEPAQEPLDIGPHPNGRVSYETPRLEKHTDMQDLILIDPVHDVGAEGWPHREDVREGHR
jgi:hypothetical protein